jgi:hypothetical protein
LSGNSFVTNTVTYINGGVGTITANGTSFAPPVAYYFSVSPNQSTFFVDTVITLTGQVFTPATNDPVTLQFFYQPVGSSSQTYLGNGSLQSSNPATVNGVSGYLQTYVTFADVAAFLSSSGDYLAFTATDNVSNLTCSYTTTTVYYYFG